MAKQVNLLKLIYIVVFILLSSIIFFFVSNVSAKRLNSLIEVEKNLVATTFKSVIDGYTSNANIFFVNVLNQNKFVEIFATAQSRPTKTREELYKLLKPYYDNMDDFYLRQLHFHLPNNESFLRFHRPNKFGDNLSDVRPTVAYVNANKEPTVGFEEGRIYSGFRFVFPLYYDGTHIGSVENSIAMNPILNSLSNLLSASSTFILDDSIIVDKVFKLEKKNYMPYPYLKGHLLDVKLPSSKLIDSVLDSNRDAIDFLSASEYNQKINSVDVSKDGKHYLLTALPIKRALKDDVVAHVLLLKENNELHYIKMQRVAVTISFIVLFGILTYYMYRNRLERYIIEGKNIKLLESETKFKNLFDMQKNIMIVTDGKKLKLANSAMWDFFGSKYKTYFEKHHKDISQRFIESENYFNLSKIEKDSNWVLAIKELAGDDKVVVMHNEENQPKAFSVAISRFDDDYIVSFTDISETIIEKMNLSKQIIRDTLTNALNREFFKLNIDKILMNIKTTKRLGVSFLDIDYFKKINDTHGHDAGDIILKEMTNLVESSIRGSDYFIRWGGEEFLILTIDTTKEQLCKSMENLRLKIEKNSFTGLKQLTCSFGVSLWSGYEDIDVTIKRADQSLYEAKDSGRNKVVCYNTST